MRFRILNFTILGGGVGGGGGGGAGGEEVAIFGNIGHLQVFLGTLSNLFFFFFFDLSKFLVFCIL